MEYYDLFIFPCLQRETKHIYNVTNIAGMDDAVTVTNWDHEQNVTNIASLDDAVTETNWGHEHNVLSFIKKGILYWYFIWNVNVDLCFKCSNKWKRYLYKTKAWYVGKCFKYRRNDVDMSTAILW